jgi:hypothetical protein
LSSVIVMILGSELRVAPQPYSGSPRWPLTRPPAPDSWRHCHINELSLPSFLPVPRFRVRLAGTPRVSTEPRTTDPQSIAYRLKVTMPRRSIGSGKRACGRYGTFVGLTLNRHGKRSRGISRSGGRSYAPDGGSLSLYSRSSASDYRGRRSSIATCRCQASPSRNRRDIQATLRLRKRSATWCE